MSENPDPCCRAIHAEDVASRIVPSLKKELHKFGLSGEPFLVDWYNAAVLPNFQLSYPPSTLAFIVISTPRMFEDTFKRFLKRSSLNMDVRDPLDESLVAAFKEVISAVADSGTAIDAIHDFELDPKRRPRLLVQTAGHVAGVAYYYRREDLGDPDPWPDKKSMLGVSLHPRYGGWFAFRGALVFRNLLCPNLPKPTPIDLLPSRELRIELLEAFNFNWRDWRYRDLGADVKDEDKYSEEMKSYFDIKPGPERKVYARKLLLDNKPETIELNSNL